MAPGPGSSSFSAAGRSATEVRDHAAVYAHRAHADIAQLGLMLQPDPIKRVDREARGLHQGQPQQQSQQRRAPRLVGQGMILQAFLPPGLGAAQ